MPMRSVMYATQCPCSHPWSISTAGEQQTNPKLPVQQSIKAHNVRTSAVWQQAC